MKKILTLLIAAGAFVTLHAQSREQTREVILGSPTNNGNYGGRDRDVILGGGNNSQYPNYPNNGSYGNNRQYEADQINREYNAKIESIRQNRYLSNQEKARAIRQLEVDRQRRIDDLNRQYNNRSGQYSNDRYDRNDRYDNNNRYDKRDNGKHKGWYKNGKNNNWKNGKYRN